MFGIAIEKPIASFLFYAMKIRLYFSLIILINTLHLKGQDCDQKATGNLKTADGYFSWQRYPCALKEYLLIYEKKPDNKKVNRKIAQCYLNSPGANKSLAINYLDFLIKAGKAEKEVYLEMGQALLHKQDFDRSIEHFNKYIELAKPGKEALKIIEKYKEQAYFSKEIIKHPVNVTFKNLGDDVNSPYNDMHPYITEKEDVIIFTSDRKGVRGGYPLGDGFFPDIMLTKVKKGRDSFKGARSIAGSFNTEFDEMAAGGSSDGSFLIYTTNEEFQIFNLKISFKAPKKRSYPTAQYLKGINGRNSNEMSATITNNGELLIFSSDRKGGYGGFDLWMSKRLPNGNWGTPINMGPNINTEFDEAFPKFSHDQSFLTFSSNGLKGLGGYDLFKTEFSEDLKIWTKPKNLGHPINSAYDDNTITFVKNGRYAYKSDIRKDSHGMRDIYRLTFNDVLPIYTVVKSSVLADTLSNMDEITNSLLNEFETSKKQLDSVKSIGVSDQIIEEYQKTYDFKQQKLDNADPFKNNFVEVTDEKGEIYGQYKTNGSDGKFIMILEPGEYKLAISHDGFDTINTKIKIYDKSNFTPELQKYFYLKPNL